MSPTLAGALAGLIIGLPGTAVALYVAIQNRRSTAATQALEKRKADRDEQKTAETSIRDLRTDVDNLWRQLGDERTARREAEDRAARAEETAEKLARRVTQLEEALHAAAIPVPPPHT